MALKAGLVNNPPGDGEGRLYAEIGRSKPAPQGICVVNSAGKVLDWVLMFDDEPSVLAFLDYTLKRFAKYPGAKQMVAAERFMKFPSAKLDDVKDSGRNLPVVERHATGTNCPATPPFRPGTVMARVFGRALDAAGKPVADTLRQEHYVEDRFDVPVEMQEALVRSLANSGTKRVRIADNFARLLVSHAYLGQLDVNPIGAPGGKGALRECEFWAQSASSGGEGASTIRIEGRSDAAGRSAEDEGVDGRSWQHEVKLEWEGLIDIRQRRIAKLLLTASGSEKLTWRNAFGAFREERDVARLPAGHAIDMTSAVRYGIIGEPVAEDETGSVEPAQPAAAVAAVPEQARRQLIEMLGPPFIVFRDRVGQELKLTAEQQQKLAQHLQTTMQDTQQVFQKIGGLPPQERDQELQNHRQKAHGKLTMFLKETLTGTQLARLRQLELQQDGPFAMGRPDISMELKITDNQRGEFMALLQKMQTEIEPLIKAAQSRGSPDEIRPKVMRIRAQCADRIESLLTASQKQEWKQMLGDPFDPAE